MKYLHFFNFLHQILTENAIFATFTDISWYLSKWIQQIWWISLQNIKSVICDLSQRCRPPPLKLSLFCAMLFFPWQYTWVYSCNQFSFFMPWVFPWQYAWSFPMQIRHSGCHGFSHATCLLPACNLPADDDNSDDEDDDDDDDEDDNGDYYVANIYNLWGSNKNINGVTMSLCNYLI